MAPPVQRHGYQCIELHARIPDGRRREFSQQRRYVETAVKFQRFKHLVYRKGVAKRRQNSRYR